MSASAVIFSFAGLCALLLVALVASLVYERCRTRKVRELMRARDARLSARLREIDRRRGA